MKIIFFLSIVCLLTGCAGNEDFKILKQTTGPYDANCYLIYGTESGEAALIDPGWEIDTLVSAIKGNNLNLRYIFITHGHTDHYYYVTELKKQFPEAKWGIHKADYDSIIKYPDWEIKAYGQEWVNNRMKDPGTRTYIDFDTESVGEPDFFVVGNKTYKIGSVEIKTLHTPGHSPGAVCYYTGNILFSGDVLFYRSAGNLDKQTSNRETFIRSVRELYRLFPDSTVVYPGHNRYTTIGEEKKENRRISMDGGEYDKSAN